MTVQELKSIVSDQKGVVVYYKSDTCAPCMVLRPKVQDLIRNNFPEMEFVLVDTVMNPELSAAFNVFANPTILVFFEGKEYIRKSKYIGVSELDQEIERIYKMVF